METNNNKLNITTNTNHTQSQLTLQQTQQTQNTSKPLIKEVDNKFTHYANNSAEDIPDSLVSSIQPSNSTTPNTTLNNTPAISRNASFLGQSMTQASSSTDLRSISTDKIISDLKASYSQERNPYAGLLNMNLPPALPLMEQARKARKDGNEEKAQKLEEEYVELQMS